MAQPTPRSSNGLGLRSPLIGRTIRHIPTQEASYGRRPVVEESIAQSPHGRRQHIMSPTLSRDGHSMSKLSERHAVPGRPDERPSHFRRIVVDVVFGYDKNFRKEKLTFEVVDFQSAYHAILGRPAYARFMARPCYVYLKLKMPGSKGVITVTGNQQRTEECLQQGSRIADQQMAILELEYKKTADPT
ncbi:hypothetical protein ZWY2020_034476 [Hordeum vulgare]|nr:hypothetical protein ZWY2020_034476 [Hordeum vulgare]